VLPKRHVWNPLQGEHGDYFRNMFEEPHGNTAQHATSYEAAMLCLA
jgi:hypothetical protein